MWACSGQLPAEKYKPHQTPLGAAISIAATYGFIWHSEDPFFQTGHDRAVGFGIALATTMMCTIYMAPTPPKTAAIPGFNKN